MRLSTIKIIALISAFCISNANAQIYTCKDANGNTIYTDSPSQCASAEEVKVDSLPALVPTKPLATSASNRSSQADEEKNLYTELLITSPANDTTLRDNQGNLTINFRASPALQTRKGHKYIVTMGGKEVYSGTSTIAALKNVDRGTHTIGVKVIDSDGNNKISATPVKVTLQRFSGLQNPEALVVGDGDGSDGSGEPESDISNQTFPRLPKLPNLPRNTAN